MTSPKPPLVSVAAVGEKRTKRYAVHVRRTPTDTTTFCGRNVAEYSMVADDVESAGVNICSSCKTRGTATAARGVVVEPGKRFGSLVVVRFDGGSGGTSRRRTWLCRCDCGVERLVLQGSLIRPGNTQQCRCWRKSNHGLCGRKKQHPLHQTWRGMVARCHNPRSREYRDYGGRGIVVCAEWRSDFRQFIADMGPRPSSKHSIDRINVNGNYEPSNCRWATLKEQMRNTRVNRRLLVNGKRMVLSEAAEVLRVPRWTIEKWLKTGEAGNRGIEEVA